MKPRTIGRRGEDVARAAAAAMAPRTRGWLVAIGCVVGAAIFAALWIVADQRNAAIARAEYEDCREDNFPSAFIRVTAERFDLDRPRPGEDPPPPRSEDVLPILWCYETVRVGRPVRLGPEAEAKYLRVYRSGRLPIVNDRGAVVGSEPFPAASR